MRRRFLYHLGGILQWVGRWGRWLGLFGMDLKNRNCDCERCQLRALYLTGENPDVETYLEECRKLWDRDPPSKPPPLFKRDQSQ